MRGASTGSSFGHPIRSPRIGQNCRFLRIAAEMRLDMAKMKAILALLQIE